MPLIRINRSLHAVAAGESIEVLPDQPLRTLDALHLALLIEVGKPRLASAGRVMAAAALACGADVVLFT